jgi:hypothetical protein
MNALRRLPAYRVMGQHANERRQTMRIHQATTSPGDWEEAGEPSPEAVALYHRLRAQGVTLTRDGHALELTGPEELSAEEQDAIQEHAGDLLRIVTAIEEQNPDLSRWLSGDGAASSGSGGSPGS